MIEYEITENTVIHRDEWKVEHTKLTIDNSDQATRAVNVDDLLKMN